MKKLFIFLLCAFFVSITSSAGADMIIGSDNVSSDWKDEQAWLLSLPDVTEAYFIYKIEEDGIEYPDDSIAPDPDPSTLLAPAPEGWIYAVLKFGGVDPTHYAIWDDDDDDAPINLASLGLDGIGGRLSHTTFFGATPVPEPATMLLLGAGLIGIAGISRKKLKK